MTKQEFEERVGMPVSTIEYNAIEVVYMNADENITKDIFCKMWAKMNLDRIKRYADKRKRQEELSILKWNLNDIYCSLRNVDFAEKDGLATNFLSRHDKDTLCEAGIEFDGLDVWEVTTNIYNFCTNDPDMKYTK